MGQQDQVTHSHSVNQEPLLYLRQGHLRKEYAHRKQTLAIHLHVAVSGVFLLLAVAGWGAFAQAAFSQKNTEAELRREVSRIALERDRVLERQRTLSAELAASKSELLIAQKGVSGFMRALDESRGEIAAMQQQLDASRQLPPRKP